jgi:glyoxylase-like metal-dependent hydrolase (beta-lactamase superfamily II)
MSRIASVLAAFIVATPTIATAQDAALRAAEKAMGLTGLMSVRYSGSGSSAMIGQGLTAGVNGRWVLENYVVDVHLEQPALRVELQRSMLDGSVPFGGTRQVWMLNGDIGWNVGANGMPAPLNPRPDVQMSSLADRQLEVWLTPPGFIKAALAQRAASRRQGNATIVTFTAPGGTRLTGTLDSQNLPTRIEAVVDNPVLGDMVIETTFTDYRPFGALRFPASIVQKHGGLTTLDLAVTTVEPNAAAAVEVPGAARTFQVAPVRVEARPLGPGVWLMAGGSHHSVLVEFADHLTLVDAPLGDERVGAVLAEARRLVPTKPVRRLIQSHHHFDHTGGTRAAAGEVDTLITAAASREYWEGVLQRPRTLRPDRLAQRQAKPRVEGVSAKRALSDATRTIELHNVPIPGHVDEMVLVYIPAERLLVQVDAPNAPIVAAIDRLKLDVATVVGLHGEPVPFERYRSAVQ